MAGYLERIKKLEQSKKEKMMTEQAYGERTRWDHRYSEFEEGTLVRQRNDTWRITVSRVCGGNNCGPHNGVAHNHRHTETMTDQEVVNLLLDWGHDLEEAKGLQEYTEWRR